MSAPQSSATVPPRTPAALSPSARSPAVPCPISAVPEPSSAACPRTRHRPKSPAIAGTWWPELTTVCALHRGLAHRLRLPLPAALIPAYPPAADACAHTVSWPHHSPACLLVLWFAPIGCPGPRRWVLVLARPPVVPIRARCHGFAARPLGGARTRSNDRRYATGADHGAAVSTRRRCESRSRSHSRSRAGCAWEDARRVWG